jgi:Fur family zinc uptake transcriptional regulator
MNKMHKENNLSKNQQIIFDLINKSPEPLKAYTILFNVQKRGIKAPPQVYRALDKLVKTGKIHKIESKNAFVACRNTNCEISKATAFSICESCEMVDEISDAKLNKYLSSFNDKKGTKYKRFNLEFFGLCKKCK